MKAPSIVIPKSRFGNVRSDDSIYQHSITSVGMTRPRITRVQDIKRSITAYDWEKALALSWQVYGAIGAVAGAIDQKAEYAVGSAWMPQYCGQNHDWGCMAEEYLRDWYQVADIRGEPYDFLTGLIVDSIAMDRDGDAAMLCVRDPQGNPRIQWVGAERIKGRYWGNGAYGYGTVPSGRFDGFKSYNGVIFDDAYRVVGYNIIGVTPDEDFQVGIESCQVLYEPRWSGQGRGIPRIATGLADWVDYQDIAHFLKRQVKQDSALGLIHYNETGAADDTADYITGSNPTGSASIKVEQMEGNEILYMQANGGGKVEPIKSDRPSPNVDKFTQRILRSCFKALGWPYELYDPSVIGGASIRLIQDQARNSITQRQRTVKKRCKRAVAHAISTAIEQGILPFDEEWHCWKFTSPALLTVDAGYEEQAIRERIKMGGGTYAEWYGARGLWWEDELRQRIKEQACLEEMCSEAGVSLDKIQMLTPNGNPKPSDATDSADSQDQQQQGDGQPSDPEDSAGGMPANDTED